MSSKLLIEGHSFFGLFYRRRKMPERKQKRLNKKGKRKHRCKRWGFENVDGEEMRFSLIFHGSYILWIFIWAGRKGCEARFIWPLMITYLSTFSHQSPREVWEYWLQLLQKMKTDPKLSVGPSYLLGVILYFQVQLADLLHLQMAANYSITYVESAGKSQWLRIKTSIICLEAAANIGY